MENSINGLLLGAGSSYELGMPLVWDLTHEIKRWLTPEKFKLFNHNWRQQGTGYNDIVVNDFIKCLENSSLQYESILGYLETQFIRNGPYRNEYHYLYSWLIEIVYTILKERHTRNVSYIQKNIRFFEGFKSLIPNDRPLWVFSLNHDLMIECLSSYFRINLCSGFGREIVSLPKRDFRGIKIGELQCQVLTGDQLENSAMNFLKINEAGINLLKIHGSLDIFTFRDGKDLLKFFPNDPSISNWIECLRSANEELIYINNMSKVKISNEIAYADNQGVMQFLRRTILSGAYKYDQRMSQTLPKKLLAHFRENLNQVSNLICVGYNFGDSHIDQIIKEWLVFRADRNLEIVDPGRTNIPPHFSHLSSQIKIRTLAFTDFLDEVGGIVRPRREKLEKELANWLRKKQFDPNKKDAFEKFIKSSMDIRLKSMAQDITTLPMKNGDIDIIATGLTQEELIQSVLDKNKMNIDDIIEKFLKKNT